MADLFNPFCRMLETIPPQGILGFLERQKNMLEEDLALKRTVPLNEVRSILNFCDFITAARGCVLSSPVVLSYPHVAFYRKTVVRMVEADVLPESATARFDATFSTALYRPSSSQYDRSTACSY